MKRLNLSILFLLPVLTEIDAVLDVTILSDANVSVGSKAEIVCLVDGIRNQVRAQDCSWISPNGTEFFASGRNKSEAGINVRIDSRRNECILTIENVSNTHSGFWECAVTQGRETVGRFAFVRTFIGDGTTPFKLLLDEDAMKVTVQRGESVMLKCPSNNVAKFAGQRPACRWLTPAGQSITLVGYFGEVHDYSAAGFELGGDIDNGECSIRISNVDLHHSGTWLCTLLRKSRYELGSEAASAEIRLNVLRSARLNEKPLLQGYYPNDRNVRIEMNVEIGSEDQLVDLYWIVQRRHLVREGETMCPNSNKKCYKSSKRRQKSPTNLFELQLAIDVLSEADIEDPIVLVKDFRNRNGQDVIEVFYVPKTSKDDLNDDSHDNDDDDDENDDDDMKRKRLNKNNRLKPKEGQDDESGCQIGDEKVEIKDHLDFPDLCVRLTCKSGGAVEPTSLPVWKSLVVTNRAGTGEGPGSNFYIYFKARARYYINGLPGLENFEPVPPRLTKLYTLR